MGLFGKKKAAAAEAAAVEAPVLDDAAAAYDAPAAGAVATTTPATELTSSSSSAAKMHHEETVETGLQQHGSQHHVGESLHTAKEATVSGASVAVLILWTIAVAGWTAFQIVTNGLLWAGLEGLSFAKPSNPKIPNNGNQGISQLEIKALWAILAIECVVFVAFLTLAVSLLWVPWIGSCRQKRRSRRTKRSFLPWFLTLVLVATAWFKLFTMSSVLNKMAYQGSWCTNGENLDLAQTFHPQGPPPKCNLAPQATAIRQAMVFAMLTIAFHMLMYFWRQPKGTFGKLFGLLPVLLVCALLLLKPVTSLMNFYITQSHFTKQGNFTFTAEIIVALIEFITAVWLSLYMGWAVHSLRLIPRFTNTLLGCCGKQYEDVYYEKDPSSRNSSSSDLAVKHDVEEGAVVQSKRHRRPHKSYELRAAGKSVLQQYYYMTQLPSVFGFVSPMITYFSLDERSWWVVFDIIVGAILIFIYIVLCGFHRKVLAPPKHVASRTH